MEQTAALQLSVLSSNLSFRCETDNEHHYIYPYLAGIYHFAVKQTASLQLSVLILNLSFRCETDNRPKHHYSYPC